MTDRNLFRTAKQIQDDKRSQNRRPREPRRHTFRVEAWAMPDERCKEQSQRMLIDSKMVDARFADEACDQYRAESGAPESAYKNRYKVGPLVIVRAFHVAVTPTEALAPVAKLSDVVEG
jgi:hypothetical protein